ncbi:MAG: TasA family protein [Acidimicrobiales bacterium]
MAVMSALLIAGTDSKASFSDSVRLGRNELVAGTVDLSLGSSFTPIVVENIAPGDRSAVSLALRNEGTLPLVVQVDVLEEVIDDGSGAITDLTLRSWFAPVCDENSQPPSETDPVQIENSRLAPGETGNFCLSVSLPLSASNSSQGRAVNFTIIVTGVHDLDRDPSASQLDGPAAEIEA